MFRFYLNRVTVAGLMCGIMFGCANPTQDFDDFRGRVANTIDATVADSGVDTAPETAIDGSIFDEAGVEAYSGNYWGTCLETTYAGDLSKITYDIFIFNLAKDASGAVTLSGTRQGLRTDATNVSQV